VIFMDEQLSQIAYAAYQEALGETPRFNALSAAEQDAWAAAVEAVEKSREESGA